MSTINIDFETRSTVDLRATGVYPYAAHPSTEILCMAYSTDSMEPMLWVPGDPIPYDILDAVNWGKQFRAWNAQFERIIWRDILVPHHGFPEVPLEYWTCTMVEAAAMALPRSLGKCADVLKVAEQKDEAGHRLMLQMSKPRRPRKSEDPNGIYWWDDAARREKLYAYCLQDVRTEAAVAGKLRRLTSKERELYLLDQQANDRGVGLDLPLVEAMVRLRDERTKRADLELSLLTDGACTKITNTADIRKWLGVDSIAKAAVAELLETETDPTRKRVLELRAAVGRSSVAKLDTMLAVELDGRAHGLLQFLGADTGRWAGRLIQPQNFPRPTVAHPEKYIAQVKIGDYDGLNAGGEIMELLSSMLRSCLKASRGSKFLCADFSAIEGWVVSWLAGQDGMTSYEAMASKIFGKPEDEITPDERTVGKVAVLGCGFGMGHEKYQGTVKDWTGMDISSDLSMLAVNTYREVNHKIKSLWYAAEEAAVAAVTRPGLRSKVGRNDCVTFRVKGPYLWAVLPSGRALCYPLPVLRDTITPWGAVKPTVEISTTNSFTRKWERRTLYGGLITENLVQAIARDVMAEAMLRVQAEGYNIVLTVHDEILAEAATSRSLTTFCDLMAVTPAWAPGLQVSVDGWEGERYRK